MQSCVCLIFLCCVLFFNNIYNSEFHKETIKVELLLFFITIWHSSFLFNVTFRSEPYSRIVTHYINSAVNNLLDRFMNYESWSLGLLRIILNLSCIYWRTVWRNSLKRLWHPGRSKWSGTSVECRRAAFYSAPAARRPRAASALLHPPCCIIDSTQPSIW